MAILRNRQAEIIIFKKNDSSYYPISYKSYSDKSNNKFRIAFDVKFDSSKNKNPAVIKIYNLSEVNRRFFNDDGLTIQLFAGYENAMNEIYKGDVMFVSNKREGANIVTEFNCGDGIQAIKDIKIKTSFNPGTKIKTIIDSLLPKIKKAGLDFKKDLSNIFSGKSEFGEVISGTFNKLFSDLCKRQDLQFTVTNNMVEITKKNKPINQNAVVLSPRTGLIGIPEQRKDDISIRTLIQPSNLFPNRLIQLDSSSISGFYIIKSCNYMGDTHGNNWIVNIDAKEYNG
jgi:hypothetical protein